MVFGVVSGLGLLALILGYFMAIIGLAALLLVVIGIIGAIASAKSNRGQVAAFCAVQGFALVLAFVSRIRYAPPVYLLAILVLLVGTIGTIVSGARSASSPAPARPQPLGYTDDGRPFYPIVGYMSDGTPVTADKAQGFRPTSPGTNPLAITSLVLAFLIAPLAIPFGHIARSQIRRTGEQGSGMALAGLIIGYVWVGMVIVALMFFLGALRY